MSLASRGLKLMMQQSCPIWWGCWTWKSSQTMRRRAWQIMSMFFHWKEMVIVFISKVEFAWGGSRAKWAPGQGRGDRLRTVLHSRVWWHWPAQVHQEEGEDGRWVDGAYSNANDEEQVWLVYVHANPAQHWSQWKWKWWWVNCHCGLFSRFGEVAWVPNIWKIYYRGGNNLLCIHVFLVFLCISVYFCDVAYFQGLVKWPECPIFAKYVIKV